MKLNLGCGQNRMAGFVNVDREAAVAPDLVMDLEKFPWPLEDDSVEEVVAYHVLEHVGAQAAVFVGIMKELYRVCRPGALVRIAVPHPRHDNFFDDPTHVRAVTPMTLSLFSKAQNLHWKAQRGSNSPFALYAGVDFEMVEWSETVVEKFRDHPNLAEMLQHWNNVASEYRMVLRVVK
ncbi:MAG: methyltransferase domain-containing protein [Burkholderiales bacterium]